jgi:hypothetical protein
MRLPDNTQHLFIVGSTGSGKTRSAVWHLSKRNYLKMPWMVIDYKRDDLIASIPAVEVDIRDRLPELPGLYVMHPDPDEQDELASLFTRIWKRGYTGTYIDEGYNIESGDANKRYRMLITQGRSLRCPVMTLSQRPVWVNKFAVSESNFYQMFRLNAHDDRKTMKGFMPADSMIDLPAFHSWYYDVGNNKLDIVKPVPSDEDIIAGFKTPPAMRKYKTA